MNTAVKSRIPGRLLQAAAYSPLGMGLPGAIGAALAHPEQKAWCVTGDGALMFSVQELITASEEELDLTLVVVENGGYREIAENMQDANIRPQGVELRQPDWPALGEAFGAASIMVDSDASDEEFARAGAFANEPGLKLIHVRQR
nr:thiamine pyrophosphate-dependent enzyme [uncultured Gulosibacter sp.]